MTRPSAGRPTQGPRGPWVLSLAVVLAALGGCRRGAEEPPAAQDAAGIHRLRTVALLEAARDTEDGYEKAAQALRRSIEIRETPGDLLNLARVLVLSGRWSEAAGALERLRRALDGAEPPADALYLEGIAFRYTGRAREAVERLEEVTRREPAVLAPWYQLAGTYSELRELERAIAAYEKLVERDPSHRGALYNLMIVNQRLGRSEESARWGAAFQRLKEEGGAEPGPRDYLVCRFTRLDRIPPPEAAAEPPPRALAFAPWGDPGGVAAIEDARSVLALDADGDRDLDLYVARESAHSLYRNDGGDFADISALSDAARAGLGDVALAADFDNDGLADLFAGGMSETAAVFRGIGEGMFQAVEESGLAPERVATARWADHDHDGDLDLIALEALGADTEARLRVWRNNGDRTFTLLESLLEGTAGISASGAEIAVEDFDLHNDIDFALPSRGGPAVLYRNERQAGFRRMEVSGLEGHTRLAAFDMDGDGDAELIGIPEGETPFRVAWNERSPSRGEFLGFRTAEIAGIPSLGDVRNVEARDLDQDGDTDLLLATSRGTWFLSARERTRFEAVLLELEGGGGAVRDVEAADLDRDGLLDLVTVGDDGRVRLWRNVAGGGAPGPYPAVTIRLVGARDNRDGVGARVEMFSGRVYQAVRVASPGGARFGLGVAERDALDGFTVLWPNGIRQPVFPRELAWDAHGEVQIEQKAGLVVSCPFLYVHDGTEYRFLTDVVGIAPLDEWVPPGGSPHLDPEEYVRIPSSRLRAVDGRLRFAITEELRETTYLDRVRLVRVRHPRGTAVQNDESTRQGAVEPLRVFLFDASAVVPGADVRGDDRRDGRELVARADGTYFHAYREGPSQWAGWVEPFSIHVLFPGGLARPPGLLLLSGRIAWQDSGVAYALHQHGRRWMPHRLDRVRADGTAEVLLGDAGFPCGMDRTLAVPLGGGVEGAVALRLTATSRLFWDRIAFAREAVELELPDAGVSRTRLAGREVTVAAETLPIVSARLDYHGYSARTGNHARHEQSYDFSRAGPMREFPSPAGYATRYGDVRELVAEPDDRLVVLAPGDALALEFDAGDAAGGAMETTYFLRLTGWAKESGFHNRTGRTIEPLPFRGMKAYPEDAAARRVHVESGGGPDEYRRYLETYQTRRVEEW